MIDRISKSDCVLCKACAQVCPKGSIKYNDNYCSFDYPSIDFATCIGCDLCDRVCPVLKEKTNDSLKICYAAKNRDKDILKLSSSGGIFYALASQVISNGGAVVGAIFDDEFRVKHEIVYSLDELPQLCGSKYVQSDMGDIFVKVKGLLKEGKTVLFSGCSCQTAALASYLGNKPSNLHLVDFICHGIVSANVFEEYKEYLENKYKGKSVDFAFRDKTSGWLDSGPKVAFDNGKSYTSPLYRDLYMQGYFKNVNLKEACSTCRYKHFNSRSDLTIGDFGGVQELYPDFFDFMGNSIIVVHNNRGIQILDSVREQLEVVSIKLEDIVKYNESLVKPFKAGNDCEEYFREAEKKVIFNH